MPTALGPVSVNWDSVGFSLWRGGGFVSLIPVRAGWAGRAGFFPGLLKAEGRFPRDRGVGQRAGGQDRSSSGGRSAGGPASCWPGALLGERALAAPINFLNAASPPLFLLGLSAEGCARAGSMGSSGGARRPGCVVGLPGGGQGRGWPVRDRRAPPARVKQGRSRCQDGRMARAASGAGRSLR